MPERLDRIRATVAELEAELRAVDSLDPETRQALAEAAREITAALHKAPPGSALPGAMQAGSTVPREGAADHSSPRANAASGSSASQSVAERLREQAAEFEATHPTLSTVVNRLVDALAQIGI